MAEAIKNCRKSRSIASLVQASDSCAWSGLARFCSITQERGSSFFILGGKIESLDILCKIGDPVANLKFRLVR